MDDAYFPPRRQELITVLLTGLVGTGLMLVLAWLAARFLIDPVVCAGNDTGLCADPFNLSYNIFIVVGALAAVALFARQLVFRPALVTLPPLVLFWSLPALFPAFVSSNILLFCLLVCLLFGLGYVLFYWLVRFKNFGISFGLLLVAVLALRWLIAS